MKIKYYISLLMTLMLALGACKKSDGTGDNNTTTPTVTKYLTHSVVISKLPSATFVTTVTDITYDAKKQKKTEKINDITYEYTYNDNGTLSSSTQRSGDGSGLRYYSEYTYAGGLLTHTSRKLYRNNVEADDQINDYVYDGNNRLAEDHYPLGGVRLYTYDSKNNVIKIEDRRLDGTVTTVNTYDANNRKITTSQTSTVSGLTPTSATYTYDSHDNNIKSISTTGTNTVTVNKTYVYDADGYMTSFTGDDGSNGTYTYSTL
jgi:hypothetical protein